LVDRVEPAGTRHDIGACIREAVGERFADARRASRNDCDFSFETQGRKH
jgi:hypothetical protein